ncbi:SufE family protein [Thioalkalicoccus limnaeus]|uniref:SufE family protein n=1 Tax=Thioalkalicoccus limnaeus TaxID=120681 RepID=A0ABV4BE17_9GAMM
MNHSASDSDGLAEIDELVAAFELLGDWDQRYEYLVELGERLPPMPASDKLDRNRVHECMSLVHIVARPMGAGDPRLRFDGDCDTAIIKGVVALLVELFSGKTPSQVERLDVDQLFSGLRLEEHLSPNRHVGVYAIVGKMKDQARAFAG